MVEFWAQVVKVLGSRPKMSRLGLAPGLSFFTMERTIGFDVDGIGGTRRLRKEEYVGF